MLGFFFLLSFLGFGLWAAWRRFSQRFSISLNEFYALKIFRRAAGKIQHFFKSLLQFANLPAFCDAKIFLLRKRLFLVFFSPITLFFLHYE
jgi:hypothetical protein